MAGLAAASAAHGRILTTIRDTVYFGGHHLARGIGVLVLWAVLPLLVATALGRRRGASASASTAAPATLVR